MSRVLLANYTQLSTTSETLSYGEAILKKATEELSAIFWDNKKASRNFLLYIFRYARTPNPYVDMSVPKIKINHLHAYIIYLINHQRTCQVLKILEPGQTILVQYGLVLFSLQAPSQSARRNRRWSDWDCKYVPISYLICLRNNNNMFDKKIDKL